MFSAGHFYYQERFSDVENSRVFGACFSPFGHGHNYVLEVQIEGSVQSEFKPILDAQLFEKLLTEVLLPLDHKHLNFEVPEFCNPKSTEEPTVVPTTENIALYLRSRVTREIALMKAQRMIRESVRLKGLKLFESPELWVEIIE
jgi:6-pyruvoyltetrahydropterin/6-carboxytetrahydropterin synthase